MAEEKVQDSDTPSTTQQTRSMGTINTNPYFQPSSKRLTKLPPLLDHFNQRDLKVLFKCCAAAWIYSLFIFIGPTLRTIGQATFFGVLVIFIVPPSGVVFISLMVGLSIVLGACLGWAWGTITMKAALATRPAADLQAQYQRVLASAPQNTTNSLQGSGQDQYTQIAIYNGALLDARVSVTYFCMIGLFVYLVARIRVAAPKLTVIQLFATIISDLYLTIAPLIPTFVGTIPRTLILPAGIGVGVAVVCNILFFPRSTSHIVLDGMQAVLAPMNTFLEACLLNFQDPDTHFELGRLKESKAKSVSVYKGMEANFGFLNLDISVGRFGTDDVKSLHGPLRRLLVRYVGLIQVQIGRREFTLRDKRLQEVVDMMEPEKEEKAGCHHLTKIYDFRERSRHPERDELLKESLKALSNAGTDLIQSCQQALEACKKSLRVSNSRRWFGRLTPQQCDENYEAHKAILLSLQEHRQAFSGRAAKDLWESHKHMFNERGELIAEEHDDFSPPIGGMMLSLVLEERIADLAEALEGLLTRLVELEKKRQHVRLWLPGNLQNLLPWALGKDDNTADLAGKADSFTSSSEEEVDQTPPATSTESKSGPESETKSESQAKSKAKALHKSKKSKKRESPDPNSASAQLQKMQIRGQRQRSTGGKILIAIAHWFSNDEGLFALRMLIVTIAIGVPAVIPSSAGFYYREKGLWALIMAQTAMVPYMADFIANFFLRMTGTVVGAVLGLLMWYIGAGNGPGNPYGMAAIAVPFVIVFMWIRLFAHPAFTQGIVLMVVTCYLVMAYSWSDTHIPTYGNPGVGYEVFWRRMLLVMVGFVAAAIVTVFPRPPSASRHYRGLLAHALQSMKNRYALFTQTCQPMSGKGIPSDLKHVTEKAAVDISELLLGIEPLIKLTKFEFSTSNFDADTLGTICHLAQNMNQSATQLLMYASYLPPNLLARFLRVTGATDENLMADIFAVISLLQMSLKTGDPLPAVMPIPLIVRSMEGAKLRTRGSEYIITLDEEKLAEQGTRQYCAAVGAFVQYLRTLDELVVVTKNAVGETTWIDFVSSSPVGDIEDHYGRV